MSGVSGGAGRIAPRTVIEALLRAGSAQSLAELYDIAAEAEIGEQAVRLAVRRMAAAGELVQRGRGRAGEIVLTDAGVARLSTEAAIVRFAFGQDRGAFDWDGQWRLVSVHAPEGQRSVRDALRRALTEAGAASISTGLYCSPHDLTGLLPQASAEYLVSALATKLEVRGESDPRRVAELCWPAAPVNDGYVCLEREVADILGRSRSGAGRTRGLLALADALERAMRPDPLLPPALRNDDWWAPHARAVWRAAWREIATASEGPEMYAGWLEE